MITLAGNMARAKGLVWRVAARHTAHLRRADARAARQEQGSNAEVSSSRPATPDSPAEKGGARAGRGAAIVVGTPR